MNNDENIKTLKSAVDAIAKAFKDAFEDDKFKPLFSGKDWDDIRRIDNGLHKSSLDKLTDHLENKQLLHCNKRIQNQRKELKRLNELNDRARDKIMAMAREKKLDASIQKQLSGEIDRLRLKNKQLDKLRVELLSEVDSLENEIEMNDCFEFTENDRIKQLESEREHLINTANMSMDYAGQIMELFKVVGGIK